MVDFSLDDACCFLGLIRCIAFFPACALAHYALQTWLYVRNVGALKNSTFKPYIQEAQELNGILSVIACAWAGLGFVHSIILLSRPTHTIPRQNRLSYLHLEIGGTIDAIIAVGLAVGVGLQSTYLPHARTTCAKANSWGTVHGQDGLFTVLSNQKNKHADRLCINFVDAWSLAMVTIIFSTMLAWVGLLSRVREGKHLWIAVTPFIALGYLVVTLFWIVKLPVATIKYLYRYARRKQWRKPENMSIVASQDKLNDGPVAWTEKPTFSKLEQVLSIEHILLPMAERLHYTDMVNLSLTCKSMREVVFPTYDREIRTKKLKSATCGARTHENCFVCNITTCMGNPDWWLPELDVTPYGPEADCQGDVKKIRPSRQFRLCDSPHCRPQCSWCAYKNLNKFWRSRRICNACKSVTPKRAICRPCGDLDREELMRRLKLRHKAAMVRMKGPRGYIRYIECADCNGKIADEWPRFWCCPDCHRHCPFEIHPAWIMRSMRRPDWVSEV